MQIFVLISIFILSEQNDKKQLLEIASKEETVF